MRFILSLVICGLLSASSFAGSGDKRFDVYWVDVEGGAATLMVTPRGESILIDTGNPGFRDPDRIAQVATKVAGLRQIDHLIITHYHGDHYGGAAPLSKLLPIKTVYDNAEWEGMPEKPSKEYREFKCERRVQINPGDVLSVGQLAGKDSPQVKLTCLGTRQQFIKPAADAPANTDVCSDARMKNRDGSDNANSVVMLIEFGPWRFLDAGDLTWNVEEKLVCPTNLVGKVDVYQVTHHGLDASNNPLVLRSVEPIVAIMNNGVTKGCLPEVFANLKETKSLEAIYQMHKNLRPDGATNNVEDEFIANKDKECNGEYIHLSVAPDGKSYTVKIPANRHERTFETRPR